MDFTLLLHTLRKQECGLTLEEINTQLEEEKKEIEKRIRKAFEDKTYQIVWKGGMSVPAYKALENAGATLRGYLKPGYTMEFGGWVIELGETYKSHAY